MTSGPCCGECGAPFDPKTWDIKVHRPGCSQGRKVAKSQVASQMPHASVDKKMIFLYHWQIIYPDLFRTGELQPVYDPEHKFDDGTFSKGWLFDFAWLDYKVAVEIDGGNRLVKKDKNGIPRAVGRHTQDSDYEKINAALQLGWVPLRYTVNMIKTKPVQCCEQVYIILMNRSRL